jgi:hypothetical protein
MRYSGLRQACPIGNIFTAWLCASRRPVRRLPRGAYEFCRWISMPDDRQRSEWSSVNSQITEGVENAVLSTRRYFSQLIHRQNSHAPRGKGHTGHRGPDLHSQNIPCTLELNKERMHFDNSEAPGSWKSVRASNCRVINYIVTINCVANMSFWSSWLLSYLMTLY